MPCSAIRPNTGRNENRNKARVDASNPVFQPFVVLTPQSQLKRVPKSTTPQSRTRTRYPKLGELTYGSERLQEVPVEMQKLRRPPV